MVGLQVHEVTAVAVVGPTEEEVTVLTARVLSAGSLPLLAGVGGQTAGLTAVILGTGLYTGQEGTILTMMITVMISMMMTMMLTMMMIVPHGDT